MSPPAARGGARSIGVELQSIRLNLDHRAVLRGIDWRIRPGERWVLLGPNGAGKTQLLKLLAGDVWPSPARGSARLYRFRGEVLRDPQGIKSEIAYLGPERQDRYEHYEWNHRVAAVVGTGLYRTDIPLDPLTRADRLRIARLLQRLDLAPLARRRFLTLSYGERRLVLLARAIAARPRLLLLDEIFNGLDTDHHARLQRILERLSRRTLPWVLATHRFEDIPASATHLGLLEHGRLTARVALSPRRRQALRTAARADAASAAARPRPPAAPAPVLLSLRRASVWREGLLVLRGLNLKIRRGDCWVVHGPNGSGKSSFLQLLYGDLGVARGGELVREGVGPGVPLAGFRRRIGFVAPELQASQPRYLSVEDVVVSGLHASVGLQAAPTRRERLRAARALRSLGAARLAPRLVRTLSYGQLRRVLFARAIAGEPDILLLDEPYAGVDGRTRAVLRERVEASVESGVTVVIATHHAEEWPRGATHELQLAHTRARYCGPLRALQRRR